MDPYNQAWGYIYINYQVHRFCPVLEVIDIFADYLAIDDENTPTINHHGNHVNRVILRIGEFERSLATLDIKRKYLGVGGSENVCLARHRTYTMIGNHVIPTTNTHIEINANTSEVWDIILTNIGNLR